jgi:hypothetical protein
MSPPGRTFVRAYSPSDGTGGHGLGLSICFSNIRDHGGTINVRRLVWEGKTRLPLEYPEVKNARTQKIKLWTILLIVDDELGMRQVLTHLFQREGHVGALLRIMDASALEQLREQAPDRIISDIRMPDMSGVDLLRAARALDADVK